ncbi:MAG TPA: hypothetical protein VED40_08560 [Azospirillaceae bacterium]|nr:hypothetical protein [Azospirillaceae bacterium]
MAVSRRKWNVATGPAGWIVIAALTLGLLGLAALSAPPGNANAPAATQAEAPIAR